MRQFFVVANTFFSNRHVTHVNVCRTMRKTLFNLYLCHCLLFFSTFFCCCVFEFKTLKLFFLLLFIVTRLCYIYTHRVKSIVSSENGRQRNKKKFAYTIKLKIAVCLKLSTVKWIFCCCHFFLYCCMTVAWLSLCTRVGDSSILILWHSAVFMISHMNVWGLLGCYVTLVVISRDT